MMKEIAVIYWSGTGNTEILAKAVADGSKSTDANITLLSVSQANVTSVLSADAIALGCPSMGAEVLEESEMEPFVESLVASDQIKGKPMVLFGSYDWGDGQWMREWENRMRDAGANLLCTGEICHLEPNAQDLEAAQALGKKILTSL